MKITIMVEKEVDLRTLRVEAQVRYWEDGTINGEPDETGENTPCKDGSLWKPIIDLESGVIKNWEKGKTAGIHYKVCDCCSCYVEDQDGKTILEIEHDYVPGILSPGGDSYGDYIIMSINTDGKIANWKADLSDFFKE